MPQGQGAEDVGCLAMDTAPPEPLAQKSFLFAFLIFFSVTVLWVGAVPMYGTPDEPAHMVRAAGIVRGQVDGVRGEDNKVRYEVPSIFVSEPGCYAFKNTQTADCLNIPADEGDAQVVSTADSYPPLFHLIIGSPTLLTGGLKSLYLMRLANALVCSLLLTVALRNVALLARRGAVAIGMAVSITPMVLFLSGPANPSGLAATAGLAIWTAALVLMDRSVSRPIVTSAGFLSVPFCVLILSRRDGLLWGGAIVLVLLAVVPWKRVVEIFRHAGSWLWASLIGLSALVQYTVWGGGNASGFEKGSEAAGGGHGAEAFAQTYAYLWQAVGVMGWLDTRMPSVVYHGWWIGIGGLIVASFVVGSRRHIAALVFAIVLLVGFTTLIGWVRFPYFQGRYYLPFAVGIPLLAGTAIANSDFSTISPRLMRVALGGLFVLHQLSFAQQLRRYAVGYKGSWFFAFDHQWSPTPGPIWLFLLGYFVASGLMLMMVANVGSTGRDAPGVIEAA